jgi:hypothetical protein
MIKAWPLEISGQGLGILGVLAVVFLILVLAKPDLAKITPSVRPPAEKVDVQRESSPRR